MPKQITTIMATAGVAVVLAAGLATTAMAEFKPRKPIEFIIMAGKGGGADKMARLMQSIIDKHDLSPRPLTPINKPGGSGAEALVYMKSKRGTAANHAVMVTLNSFYTTPMRQPSLKIDSLTFAPVARMAEDTFLLWVNKDSGITNLDGFVKAARARGRDWIMAGTGKGQEDQLLTDFLNKAYGLEMKYVPFKGGGRVAKELAGNQANSTVNNPSEQDGFHAAGTTVPLAAFTGDRLAKFPEAPTFTELGKSFEYYMQRSVVGAPNMSADAQEFYSDLFRKVYESAEWQKYMTDKSLQGAFMSGQALRDYWDVNNATHRTMLEQIGEI